MSALLALISVFILFFVFLFVKEFLPKKIKTIFCALCTAVAITWLGFLLAFYKNVFHDKVIIALLLGGTVVGILYVLWKKYKFFLLPIFLTLVAMAYSIIEKFEKNALFFVIFVWFLFFIIFLFKKNKFIKKSINKIIACCRNW